METTIVVEGKNATEARRTLQQRIPRGKRVAREEIEGGDYSSPIVVESYQSGEDAMQRAESALPSGATVLSREIAEQRSTLEREIQAFDLKDANEKAAGLWGSKVKVEQVVLQHAGVRGFLGIGRKPGLYKVVGALPAIARIEFDWKVRITAHLEPDTPTVTKNTIWAISIVTNRAIPMHQAEAWVKQVIRMRCKYGVYEDLMESRDTKFGFAVAGEIDFQNPTAVIPALLLAEQLSGPDEVSKLTFGDFSDTTSGIRGCVVAHFRRPL